MEVNPKNPGLTMMREQWQKLLLVVMAKLELTELTITEADIAAANVDVRSFILADFRDPHAITLRRLSERDAYAAARAAGERLP